VALSPIGTADPEKWLKQTNDQLNAFDTDRKTNANDIENREAETKGYVRADLGELELRLNEATARLNELNTKLDSQKTIVTNHKTTLDHVSEALEQRARLTPVRDRLRRLSEMANGPANSSGRKSFENYVLSTNFREILEAANERLMITSGGRYRLVQQQATNEKDKVSELDMDIVDNLNDHTRKTGSISGGEGFQVSMALALGLSDVVQNHAGGIRIESMFIDEGFGSLDGDLLDKAIQMLSHLAGNNRQIGIISHVSALDENISPKLVVTGDKNGSHIRFEE